MKVQCPTCKGSGTVEKESVDEAVARYYACALKELQDPPEEWEAARPINIMHEDPSALFAIKNSLIAKLKEDNKIAGASSTKPLRSHNGLYYLQTVYLKLFKQRGANAQT